MSERNKEHGTPHSAKKSAKKKDKSLLEAASSEEDLIHAGGSGGTGTTSVKASMKQKMSSATHIFGKKLAVKTAKLHKPTDKQQLADRASSPTHDTAAGGPRRSSRAGDSGKEKWSYSNDNAEQDWPAVPPAPVFGVPLQVRRAHSCDHTHTDVMGELVCAHVDEQRGGRCASCAILRTRVHRICVRARPDN
jgi:hypothetical protein